MGAPAVHIFAPPYYAAGEGAHDLLRTLDYDPHAYSRVWVLVAGHDATLQNFPDGPALAEKLQSIYGPPTLQTFADVIVLEYGH